MRPTKVLPLLCLLTTSMGQVSLRAAQTPRRISSKIEEGQTFVLKGNIRPVVVQSLASDQGAIPDTQLLPRITLHFAMTAAQSADLKQLLSNLQNPSSSEYHKFLTPDQFADRFGLNEADVAKVSQWLENNGFSNIQASHSRSWITFSATAAQAQAAFHTQIHKYSLHGETYFANVSDPQLPAALEGLADGMLGLNNFRMKPNMTRPQPRFSASNGTHYLSPADWATIYNVTSAYSLSASSTPTTIAIMGQSEVYLSDLAAFRTASGIAGKNPTTVVVDADPGVVSGDEEESDLDLEWSAAIAGRNANLLFIVGNAQTGSGVDDALLYAADHYSGIIISTAYGVCETDISYAEFEVLTAAFSQANAQGSTVIAASGDSGAAGCDTGTIASHGLVVNFPASSEYVTAVGGTTLSEGSGSYWNSTNGSGGGSAVSYIPEVAWNDGNQASSGGGASTLVSKPAFQQYTTAPTPNDNARDVPDIAFAASADHDGYLICANGNCVNGFLNSSAAVTVAGGSSAATAAFAGVLAILLPNASSALRGNINAPLYQHDVPSNNVFHDITSGSNIVACQTGTKNCSSSGQMGYSAVAGYDQVTGLGSLNADNIITQWNVNFVAVASPTSLSIKPGAAGASTININTYQFASGYQIPGPIALSCSVSSSLANVTCSVPGSVSSSGGAFEGTTLTVNVSSAARHWPVLPVRTIPWLLMLLVVSLAGFAAKRRPGLRWKAATLVLFAIGAVSCGSGSSKSTTVTSSPVTPSETGTVTVSASYSGITSSTSVAVSVVQ